MRFGCPPPVLTKPPEVTVAEGVEYREANERLSIGFSATAGYTNPQRKPCARRRSRFSRA